MLDLHVHTKYSPDGTGDVRDYVAKAREIGLSGISITDHNNVQCTDEAIHAANEIGLAYVPGAEFNGAYATDDVRTILHIAAYSFDPSNEYVQRLIRLIGDREQEHTQCVIEGLQRLGFDITPQAILDVICEKTGWTQACERGWGWPELGVPRQYIHGYLFLMGWAKDHAEGLKLEGLATKAMGREGFSAFIDLDIVSGHLQMARGITVLAHPFEYGGALVGRMEDVIGELATGYGVQGVEVYHKRNTPAGHRELLRMTDRLGLVVTGGSDTHEVEGLGTETVPADVMEALLERYRCNISSSRTRSDCRQ